jgi:hypothetical protein
MFMGAGIMAYGTAGLFLSDWIGEKLGIPAADKDKQASREAASTITVVERRRD